MLLYDAQRVRLLAIDHETVTYDARALLLTNARHGFQNRARHTVLTVEMCYQDVNCRKPFLKTPS